MQIKKTKKAKITHFVRNRHYAARGTPGPQPFRAVGFRVEVRTDAPSLARPRNRCRLHSDS